jgi:uncharacterized protein (TIGR02453 family)
LLGNGNLFLDFCAQSPSLLRRSDATPAIGGTQACEHPVSTNGWKLNGACGNTRFMATKRPATSAFSGFSTEALKFLRDLAKHNDRAWFAPRKAFYEENLLDPLRSLVLHASEAMRKARIPLGSDPRSGTFRIYRDVRFSPDKSPYKTNLGAFLAHNGNHDAPGGLYVHVQPAHSFIAIGFYRLDKPHLQRWRDSMARDPKPFESALRALDRNGFALSESEEQLKRMPRGFESQAESMLARYFRRSSFMVSENLSDAQVCSPQIIERMVDGAKRAKPLLEYGWSTLS